MKIVPCVENKNKTKQNKTKTEKQFKWTTFPLTPVGGRGWGERLLKRNFESTTSLLENRMKLMVALPCNFSV